MITEELKRGKARRCACIFFVLLLSSIWPGATPCGTKKKSVYRRTIYGGWDMVRFVNTCLIFEPSMTSGDFFEGLQKLDSPDGTTFAKNSQRIELFPEDLTVEIKIAAVACMPAKQESLGPIRLPDDVAHLRFDAQWKENMRLFEAQVSAQTFNVGTLVGKEMTWYRTLTIHSATIPISDHVIVAVSSDDGRRIARVSVGL